MNYDNLIHEAKSYAEKNYLSKPKLGQDEELQLVSCAYTVLFLTARANKAVTDLAAAHEFISKCFEKIGDKNYSDRHRKLAAAYTATVN